MIRAPAGRRKGDAFREDGDDRLRWPRRPAGGVALTAPPGEWRLLKEDSCRDSGAEPQLHSVSIVPRLQRLLLNVLSQPRALPWAFAFRAFGPSGAPRVCEETAQGNALGWHAPSSSGLKARHSRSSAAAICHQASDSARRV